MTDGPVKGEGPADTIGAQGPRPVHVTDFRGDDE